MTVAYYIMIASHLGLGDHIVRSDVIFDTLIRRGVWFLSPFTPFRTLYEPGDRLLFYLGGAGNRCFVASAEVASAPEPVTSEDKIVLKGLGIPWFDTRLPLHNTVIWHTPKPMPKVKFGLSFIKDKKNYGLYLRQGAKRISEEDYRVIVDA